MDRPRTRAMFERFGPAVYWQARAALGSEAGGEEALEAVFVRALSGEVAWPRREALGTWLSDLTTEWCRDRGVPAQHSLASAGGASASFPDNFAYERLLQRIMTRAEQAPIEPALAAAIDAAEGKPRPDAPSTLRARLEHFVVDTWHGKATLLAMAAIGTMIAVKLSGDEAVKGPVERALEERSAEVEPRAASGAAVPSGGAVTVEVDVPWDGALMIVGVGDGVVPYQVHPGGGADAVAVKEGAGRTFEGVTAAAAGERLRAVMCPRAFALADLVVNGAGGALHLPPGCVDAPLRVRPRPD